MADRRGVSVESLSDDDVSTISKDVWININSVAFFYDDRFKENFVSDGAAFSEDEMVVEDFQLCGQFAQAVADQKG
jgi:hypothetical protein